MSRRFELADEAATVALGWSIGRVMTEGGVVFLLGTLGAGKTTLTRGILQALGHTGSVKSPTYTLVEPYQLGANTVYHFDLYRLGEPEELEYMGIRDYFFQRSLCIVEWPGKGEGYLPAADLSVTISLSMPGRIAEIAAGSKLGEKFLEQLESGG